MTRVSLFNSPLLLGFEQIERSLDRISKATADGYPPYNIERIGPERLRISLAVAGFQPADLAVQVEGNSLIVTGRQSDDEPKREFLHCGIAARQFKRTFLLADGVDVVDANMQQGLLHIDLQEPTADQVVRFVPIRDLEQAPPSNRDG